MLKVSSRRSSEVNGVEDHQKQGHNGQPAASVSASLLEWEEDGQEGAEALAELMTQGRAHEEDPE